jgi:hypothetical protein
LRDGFSEDAVKQFAGFGLATGGLFPRQCPIPLFFGLFASADVANHADPSAGIALFVKHCFAPIDPVEQAAPLALNAVFLKKWGGRTVWRTQIPIDRGQDSIAVERVQDTVPSCSCPRKSAFFVLQMFVYVTEPQHDVRSRYPIRKSNRWHFLQQSETALQTVAALPEI